MAAEAPRCGRVNFTWLNTTGYLPAWSRTCCRELKGSHGRSTHHQQGGPHHALGRGWASTTHIQPFMHPQMHNRRCSYGGSGCNASYAMTHACPVPKASIANTKPAAGILAICGEHLL